MGSEKPWATLRGEVHAAQEILKARPEYKDYSRFAYSALACLRIGDVGVGVFPEREEILVSSAGFGRVFLHGVSAGQSEAGQRAPGEVPHQAAMVDELLKFCSRCGRRRAA